MQPINLEILYEEENAVTYSSGDGCTKELL